MKTILILCLAGLFVLAPVAGASEIVISIRGRAFHPASVRVHAGDVIVWTNDDEIDYTVDESGGSFASPNLKPGQSYSHRVTQKGTIDYGSRLYPRMHGRIVVE